MSPKSLTRRAPWPISATPIVMGNPSAALTSTTGPRAVGDVAEAPHEAGRGADLVEGHRDGQLERGVPLDERPPLLSRARERVETANDLPDLFGSLPDRKSV